MRGRACRGVYRAELRIAFLDLKREAKLALDEDKGESFVTEKHNYDDFFNLRGDWETQPRLRRGIRILLAILMLSWLNVPLVEAAITLLDNSSGITSNGTSVTAHFWGGYPASGDLLVAQVSNNASSSAPTTPTGWSVAISETNNSPGQVIFYKIADGTEGPDITISGYGTSTFLALLTFRYSGVATYNPLDQTSSKSGTGTAISTNSITTTRANELLIAGVCQSKSSSFSGWGSSFTVRSGIQGTASASYADRIVSSTGTYSTSVTASQSGAWRAHMASFKAVTKTWDGGASTNNWGDANNWNPNGVPASTDVIELTGANTIDINVAAVGMDLYLNNASLTLTVKSGQSLTVGGNLAIASGTLNTEASFPTVTGTTTINGGTVGYTAASGSQTVAAKSYVNLTISGGGTKTLAGTITPTGNLSVNGGTLDLSTYTANRSTGGGTLTVANGATLKIGGTGTLPSNYSTHSIGATSTVEFAGTTTSVGALNSSQNYGNLTISGSGVVGSASFAVATALSVGSGGSFIPTAGTVTMNNGSSISNSGTLTFQGLTIAASATVTTSSKLQHCRCAHHRRELSLQPGRRHHHDDGDRVDIVIQRGTNLQGTDDCRHAFDTTNGELLGRRRAHSERIEDTGANCRNHYHERYRLVHRQLRHIDLQQLGHCRHAINTADGELLRYRCIDRERLDDTCPDSRHDHDEQRRVDRQLRHTDILQSEHCRIGNCDDIGKLQYRRRVDHGRECRLCSERRDHHDDGHRVDIFIQRGANI